MSRYQLLGIGTLILFLGTLASEAYALPPVSRARSEKAAELSIELGYSVVRADQKNSAFLKVGVTGRGQEAKERAHVNVSIVIDKSGSMQGAKIEEAKRAAMLGIMALQSHDIVSIVAYDDFVSVILPATRVSDKEAIQNAISNIEAEGSTALFAGVSKGGDELHKFIADGGVNRVILLSDGQANIGPSSPGELAELGQALARDGISVTTVGLGTGYNEDLMTRLARSGDGSHYFVENERDLAGIYQREFGDVLSVVAQKTIVEIECAKGVRPVRVLGRDATIEGQRVTVSLNQLYSQHEKYFLLEVEVPETRAGARREIATATATYDNLIRKAKETVSDGVSLTAAATDAEARLSANPSVMVVVAEYISNEQNKLALELRDMGKIDEARLALIQNADYIRGQRAMYPSERLRKLEQMNRESSEMLSPLLWNKNRKNLRYHQDAVSGNSVF